jgi:lipoprotein signal peptidase
MAQEVAKLLCPAIVRVVMLLRVLSRLSRASATRALLPFIAVTAGVIFVNEACSALARYSVAPFRAFWLVRPVVFITNFQNSEGTAMLQGAAGRLAYGLITIFACGLALRSLRRHQDHLFCWHRVGAGLLIGGMVSNGYQLVILGAVTDFIGVRPLGLIGVKLFSRVFNLADASIFSGTLMLVALLLNSRKLAELGTSIRITICTPRNQPWTKAKDNEPDIV